MSSENFKNLCRDLRMNGHTLGEISSITKRPKTTVYFHVQNIPLSDKLLRKIRNIKINAIKGKGPVKGKSLLGYKYKDFSQWNSSRVNLLAHALFDGAIRREGVLYYNRSRILIRHFKNLMSLVYNGEPKIYKNKNGVIRVAYHNVELSAFFKKKSEQLLNDILKLPASFQREFLKAFFDDEGSVDFRLNQNKRRIKGYQHRSDVLNLVYRLLKNFGINSYVDHRFKEILITKKENIKQFAKEINFSKGIKVNGNRANSIWKKDLEKRQILKMAIDSYFI